MPCIYACQDLRPADGRGKVPLEPGSRTDESETAATTRDYAKDYYFTLIFDRMPTVIPFNFPLITPYFPLIFLTL